MQDKHGVDLENDPRVTKTLFRIMTDVSQGDKSVGLNHDDIQGMNLRELNNLTLNIARDVFVKEQKPAVREQSMLPRPSVSPNMRQELDNDHSRLMIARHDIVPTLPTIKEEPKEEPIGSDDFDKRLAAVELMRGIPTIPNTNSTTIPPTNTPPTPPTTNTPPTPPNTNTTNLDKYVTMAGFDRNWEVDKSRYAYTVNVAGSSFKNVVAMAVKCVIIPASSYMERNSTLTFSHPYLLLNIDNMQMYEGTNDAIRRCFTVLKYDKAYRTHNGRGYIVMLPVQDEVKTFHPAPMPLLHNLNLSLRKPNGVLVSNALDDYRIMKLEYDAVNRMYIKVVVNKYFDKNEFFPGDSVYFRKCEVDSLHSLPSLPNLHNLHNLLNFLNRPEGHDVTELGQPNDNHFYRTFYILAPGVLDQDEGKITLDTDIITLVQTLSDANSSVTGGIVNASLQLVVSMRITVAVPV